MKMNLTKADVTQDVIDGVTEVMARMAIAQVTREKVDEIQRKVLEKVTLYNDLRVRQSERRNGVSQVAKERITDPDQTYLSEDEEAMTLFYGTVDELLRLNGIKPDDMETDYCPALVAERKLVEAEWALLDAAAEMMGMEYDGKELNHRLLCHFKNGKSGLDHRQEFIDLLCGLVVNL